jgi:hypothetical protein
VANIAKVGWPTSSSIGVDQDRSLGGLVAGEDIGPADCLYVGADGKVYRCDATAGAAGVKTRFRGNARQYARAGEAVTIARGQLFPWGSGLTPGKDVFLSLTVVGGIDDAAAYTGAPAVGYCWDTQHVMFYFEN